MALDPDVAAQVAHLFDATLAEVISGAVAGPPAARPLRRDDVVVTDATVPGSGGPVPIRVCRSAALAPAEPAPALVWAHGGGWQYGDLDMPEAHSVAQVVAAGLPGVVVSVGYRLAPQHRHPAGLDDIVAVHRWATSAGGSHGIDRDRVALGGASAGAHLSIGAAAAFRDAAAPAPRALLLAYPVTDPLGGPYPPERDPECPPLLWLDAGAVAGLFGRLGDDIDHPPASAVPAAVDLAGFPAMLVTTAECDALTPQAHRFAARAREAGVDVAVHDVPGVLHGYLNTVGSSGRADEALASHVEWLRSALA